MIVWRGKGWLVGALAFGCLLIANELTDTLTGTPEYWNAHRWPMGVSLLIAGTICWFIGEHLEKEQICELIDKETAEDFIPEPRDSFFWIPVKWCGALMMVVSAAIVLVDITAG